DRLRLYVRREPPHLVRYPRANQLCASYLHHIQRQSTYILNHAFFLTYESRIHYQLDATISTVHLGHTTHLSRRNRSVSHIESAETPRGKEYLTNAKKSNNQDRRYAKIQDDRKFPLKSSERFALLFPLTSIA